MKEQIEKQVIMEMADEIRRIRESYFGQADYLFAKKLFEDGYRKQEWISVKDRLPEESGEYLVFGRTFGNKKPKIWICECIGIGSVMGWCNSAKNPIVEAWMPLPEPPKMKGGAE